MADTKHAPADRPPAVAPGGSRAEGANGDAGAAAETGPAGFWESLLSFRDFKNSLKLRKDYKLKEKLYMTAGGDYCFQTQRFDPVLQLTYKFNDKLRADITPHAVTLQRRCKLEYAGVCLNLTPNMKINFAKRDKKQSVKLGATVNSLRPIHVVVGVMAIGLLRGNALKTSKQMKIPKLSNVAADYSRAECQGRFGLQTNGVSGLGLHVSEVNLILRVGPPVE
ncbi:unnamed protein product [Ostreobium quekettii]|uniref:Uncharacterized protein n=1 Tax=Ostreobium quekettii TaxID=121088 RepID=A0A8S1J4E0_9CHLO|nr:unnamed protein product [Ostreobium quekettii]